jgi:hypothetical protein
VSSVVLGAIVFFVLCVATVAGMRARFRLPDHHLNLESKDVIRLATAVVGTLSALALGLLIASAKSTFDTADTEMRSSVARVLLLDRVMAHYGPETEEARQSLRTLVERRLERGWSVATTDQASGKFPGDYRDIEAVQDRLRELKPQTDAQRLLQGRALEISGETDSEGLPWAFLTILVFWLSLLFGTFGLQAPPNLTVFSILLICALSVAGAVFLIVDMANPYIGLIHISGDPLRAALLRLGQP